MRFAGVALAFSAIVANVAAQRPSDISICDYYTTALLKNNTADNQYNLLVALVNTVVIGNYTQPNVGITVPGILAEGIYNGTNINLLPYFDGTLNSTNRGGSSGKSVNFLDGGGATPLKQNKAADDENSKQYKLLTHLYQFFGTLLGCSMQGMPAFPAYQGNPSMFKVHKFMNLKPAELGYFVQQVALAGASFGVAKDDLEGVGMALEQLFGLRCAPPMEVVKSQGAQLQAICIDQSCPLAQNAVCSKYDAPDNATPAGTSTSTTPASSATSAVATGGLRHQQWLREKPRLLGAGHQTTKRRLIDAKNTSSPAPALAERGPHGLPMRFVVRGAGRGFKLCGEDAKAPIYYIQKQHALFSKHERLILHTSGHKKDKSPPLISIKKGVLGTAPVGGKNSKFHVPNFESYNIELHNSNQNNVVEMKYEGRKGLAKDKYAFTLFCNGRRETFRWYEADRLNCSEVREIHKRQKPIVKTGMPKDTKKKRIGTLITGSYLIRVTDGAPQCPGNPNAVLGWDEKGREIVASYARGGSGFIGGTKMFFQFWGSAAKGQFGEDFTRIAAISGTALWREQIAEQQAAQQRNQNLNR
ncbi:hypothetical protein F5144DRAFT_497587 [Chaetomium tenue]|uniref:Uncharacterized protein n=1 Tax=Chaetomium tenue TaxID=1854479 RepID=A0ACB7NW85_9PEZI|nr:hypothetical protein F5144DRAFT_497587 [Chaetomium globosum]